MIKIENVSKSFGNRQILKRVSLEISRGESLVIIGRSGVGKSVLLKLMMGLMEPDEGRVLIDDRDIATVPAEELFDFRMKLGMLFQGAALFDSLNVRENVGFSLYEHKKLPDEQIRERVRENLALVGLKGIEEFMPADLSGGMRKRVGLARALSSQPEIMLYDEPTTGLDPINADVINDLILATQKKLEVTSVVVTHDMKSAYKVGDRLAMLYQGEIIESGTADEILQTQNPIVKQFITGSAKGPIR